MARQPGRTWSHTLSNDIEDLEAEVYSGGCLRRIYYRVYESWGGWSRRGSPMAYQCYEAKQSASSFMLVGKVLHDSVAKVLRAVKAGIQLPPEDSMTDRIEQIIVEAVSYSRAGLYKKVDSPKQATCIMTAHLRGENISAHTVGEMVQRSRTGMEVFLAQWLPKLQQVSPDQWLSVDALDAVHFCGYQCFMVPDFLARWTDPGAGLVLDWKSGVTVDAEQIKVYMTYTQLRDASMNAYSGGYAEPFGFNRARLVGESVSLLTGESARVEGLTEADEQAVRARIKGDIAILEPLHEHGLKRDPGPFPRTIHRGRCPDCSYQHICDLDIR